MKNTDTNQQNKVTPKVSSELNLRCQSELKQMRGALWWPQLTTLQVCEGRKWSIGLYGSHTTYESYKK